MKAAVHKFHPVENRLRAAAVRVRMWQAAAYSSGISLWPSLGGHRASLPAECVHLLRGKQEVPSEACVLYYCSLSCEQCQAYFFLRPASVTIVDDVSEERRIGEEVRRQSRCVSPSVGSSSRRMDSTHCAAPCFSSGCFPRSQPGGFSPRNCSSRRRCTSSPHRSVAFEAGCPLGRPHSWGHSSFSPPRHRTLRDVPFAACRDVARI